MDGREGEGSGNTPAAAPPPLRAQPPCAAHLAQPLSCTQATHQLPLHLPLALSHPAAHGKRSLLVAPGGRLLLALPLLRHKGGGQRGRTCDCLSVCAWGSPAPCVPSSESFGGLGRGVVTPGWRLGSNLGSNSDCPPCLLVAPGSCRFTLTLLAEWVQQAALAALPPAGTLGQPPACCRTLSVNVTLSLAAGAHLRLPNA